MKIIRVICYEGELDALQRQMASSLPDCKREGTRGVTIEVRTVVDERPKDMADEAVQKAVNQLRRGGIDPEPTLYPSGIASEFWEGDDDWDDYEPEGRRLT